MTMRARYKLEISLSSTSAEDKDLGNAKMEVVCDSQNEGGVTKHSLAAGATNVSILPPGTSRFVALRTLSKDPTLRPVGIDIKRNSTSAEVISVVPLPEATEGHMLLSTDGLTALYASNPSTTVAMEVTVFAVGG